MNDPLETNYTMIYVAHTVTVPAESIQEYHIHCSKGRYFILFQAEDTNYTYYCESFAELQLKILQLVNIFSQLEHHKLKSRKESFC